MASYVPHIISKKCDGNLRPYRRASWKGVTAENIEGLALYEEINHAACDLAKRLFSLADDDGESAMDDSAMSSMCHLNSRCLSALSTRREPS